MSCCGGAKMPPLTTQVVTFAAAVGRVVEAVIEQEPVLVSNEVAKERLAICAACPKVVAYPKGFLRCSACGCGLNGWARRKAYQATETCEFWPTS